MKKFLLFFLITQAIMASSMNNKKCYSINEIADFIKDGTSICDKKICIFDLNFNFASAKLQDKSFAILNEIANIINTFPNTRLRVTGHTDSIGSEVYNIVLSNNRAKMVADYLVKKGIPSDSISHRGLGESNFIESNGTDFGRAKNRRVEIELLYKCTDKKNEKITQVEPANNKNIFVIPDSILPEKFRPVVLQNMNIYEGDNPPNIKGRFKISENITTHIIDDNISEEILPDVYLYFFNCINGNQLCYSEKNGNIMSKIFDKITVIGSGNNFTVFFMVDKWTHYPKQYKMSYIISGTMTNKGIVNVSHYTLMLDKYDPQNTMRPINSQQIIKDKDGTAETINWEIGKPMKQDNEIKRNKRNKNCPSCPQ